jgi:hypothetical protein
MSHSFVIGDRLVSSEELLYKIALGETKQFKIASDQFAQAFHEYKGDTERGLDETPIIRTPVPQFEPIGIGKPISIEILSIYTGDAPSLFPWDKPDLLVVSAIKGIETFDAAPRGINQLVEGIKDNQFIQPSALANGSPIVYYSPSLVNNTLLCTFQLAVRTFNKQVFQQISTLFSSAVGFPIFAPASAYLVAGSILTKIAGELAEALLQSDPFLHEDIHFPFDTPDVPQAYAHQIVIYNTRDEKELSLYSTGLTGPEGKQRVALIHKENGQEYQGIAPYLIISLDGRKRPDLEAFTPKLASAAVLEQFYRGADPGGKVVETLGSALELYNDFSFRQKVDRIKANLQSLDPKSQTYAKDKEALEKLLAAYSGNIRNPMFKPQ